MTKPDVLQLSFRTASGAYYLWQPTEHRIKRVHGNAPELKLDEVWDYYRAISWPTIGRILFIDLGFGWARYSMPVVEIIVDAITSEQVDWLHSLPVQPLSLRDWSSSYTVFMLDAAHTAARFDPSTVGRRLDRPGGIGQVLYVPEHSEWIIPIAFGDRGIAMRTVTLTGVHSVDRCEGHTCSLHRPSIHSARMLPFAVHPKDHRQLRICLHGQHHPDLDSVDLITGERDSHCEAREHECDGCCVQSPIPEDIDRDG